MAAKAKAHPLNGMHTAGIYSDMTIDGPPIGTLVVVVDRAKNLPNRKTIGKQDPYCAARLGKEAKKTTTDIRGGQTPKWDQELRFTVHDCPDYYQLKISAFNDDKKTDLIGETWIDLRDIIVSGGGQSDCWHQLACKGKYAGEIRIEITYYDTRPKPERPAAKAKPTSYAEVDGPRAQPPRPVPKRRPLPTDPITGKAPSPVPAPAPAPAQQTPDYIQTPLRGQPNAPASYIPNQSPLQQVEYKTTPPVSARYQQQDHPSPGFPTGGYEAPVQQYHTPDRNDRNATPHDNYPDGSPSYRQQPYESQSSRPPPSDAYMLQMNERPVSPDDDTPPPPPVHRSRNNSAPIQEQIFRSGYDGLEGTGTPPTMRHDVLRNEAHRQSVSTSYPGRPTYRAFESAQYPPEDHDHRPASPSPYPYQSAYDSSARSMQPTVEDAPESPAAMMMNSFRRSSSRMPQYEPEFDLVASPAPLQIGSRDHASSGRYSPSFPYGGHQRQNSGSYQADAVAPGDPITQRPQSSSDPYNAQGQLLLPYRSELDDTSGAYSMPSVPPSLVPGMDTSLVQEIAHRINHDRRAERRYTQPPVPTPRRGSQINDLPTNYAPGGSPVYATPQQSHSRSPITYTGSATTPTTVSPIALSPVANREPSPNPRHTIRRKSISPAPPNDGRHLSSVPFGPDSYDALNPTAVTVVQEPSMSGPDYSEVNGKIITHDGREVDPSDHLPMDTWAPEPEPKNKKPPGISPSRPTPAGPQALPPSGRRQLRIAGHPQPKAPNSRYASQNISSDPPAPSTPVNPGRNRLQKKSNRSSAAPVISGAIGSPGGDPFTPHGGSSPLAPLQRPQDNFTPPRPMQRASTFDYQNENHAPMYGSSPGEGFRPGTRGSGTAPPIPAKVPLAQAGAPVMSGALPARRDGSYGEWGSAGAGGGDLSLVEEMRRIDIGAGRSRRHGHGY